MSFKKTRWFVRALVMLGCVCLAYFLILKPTIKAGDKLPEYTVYGSDGTQVSSLFFPKVPTLVHFWANWCDACVYELDDLVYLKSQLKDDLLVVAIHEGMTHDDLEKAKGILSKKSLNYPVYYDKGSAGKLFGIDMVPMSFLVNADGVILKRYTGVQNWRSKKLQGDIPLP